MLYAKRTVRCSAKGITRETARTSLESSDQFTEGSELIDLRRRGEMWVATVLEPKIAEFPPSDDDDGDSGESGPPKADSESDSDGPPSDDGPPMGDGPPKEKGKGGEKAELSAVLDILSLIADKLGVGPGAMAPGGEDPMMGGGPPPPPPPGPPMGGPAQMDVRHKTKMKPGDAPPGSTPIGAPAFASTLARLASFDAFDDTPGKSIKTAKEELESLYGPHGFQVRQIKRVENGKRLAAKLTRR